MERLTREQLRTALADLPDWQPSGDDGHLRRDLEFADFTTAFAFMTAVALEAQALDHHPDWSNSWNRVSIRLSTHTANGVTERDLELARRIDAHAAN